MHQLMWRTYIAAVAFPSGIFAHSTSEIHCKKKNRRNNVVKYKKVIKSSMKLKLFCELLFYYKI